MGIVIYGGGVTQIKGRVGGAVFQVAGQTKSVRVMKMHKPASSQTGKNARHHLSVLASAWQSLSLGQQSSFDSAADTWPAVNRYGIAIILTGYQLFVLLNKRMALINAPLFSSCNNFAVASLPNISFDDIDYGTSQFTLHNYAAWPTNVYCFIYLTVPIPWYNDGSKAKLVFLHCFSNLAIGDYNCWSYLNASQKIAISENKQIFQFAVCINTVTNAYQKPIIL